jgi:hypothetical protein
LMSAPFFFLCETTARHKVEMNKKRTAETENVTQSGSDGGQTTAM